MNYDLIVDLVLIVLILYDTFTLVSGHRVPPTDSIVNGDAVGESRIASSSTVKGSRGMTTVRRGTINRIITGNPIEAMVCTIANVAAKATSCTLINSNIRDLRTRRKGSERGVS